MTTPRTCAALAALTALAAVCAETASAAPIGTPFGNGKASASIATVDGEPDVDDYVAPMLAGETLSLVVAASKGSALLPAVRLLDPSGADRTPALVTSKEGHAAAFTSFAIDSSGVWTLSISGAGGTEGAYTAAFKIKALTKFGVAKGLVPGSGSGSISVPFEAVGGASVSLTLRPLGGAEVFLTQILDGLGHPDQAMLGAVAVKKGVSSLKKWTVTSAPGTFGAGVATTSAPAGFRLDATVSVPRRKGSARYAAKEPRLTAAGSPVRVAAGFPVTLSGHDISNDPAARVFVSGVEAQVESVSADRTSVTIVVPQVAPSAAARVDVLNADGQSSGRAGLVQIVSPPAILDLRDVAANPARKGRLTGAEALRVVGSGFDSFTEVLFGTEPATVTLVTANSLSILTPAHARGMVTVSVRDDFGRQASMFEMFFFAAPGWAEGDGGRLPAVTAADDFRAARAAVGEFGGGKGADIVLASPLRTFSGGHAAHGTRATNTRILTQNATGVLVDATAAKFPAAQAAAFPYDTDDWNASALAIGDIDSGTGPDIVIAGFAEVTSDGFSGGFSYGQNLFASGIRAFRNDGTGRVTLSAVDQPLPQRRRPPRSALDENQATRPLFGPFGDDRGDPTAIAIADLDGDLRPELVVARSEFGFRRIVQDLTNVDFTQDPPRIPAADANAFSLSPELRFAFVAGTEIVRNGLRTGGGLDDVTDLRMPISVGGDAVPDGPEEPGYHADDVAAADIDLDGDQDLVLVWRDPTTVSVRGRASFLESVDDAVSPPVSIDVARIATRILLNDGTGRFADVTAAWMPAAAGNEYWQASRVALTNLDGDARPDLVLVSREGLEAWTTTALAGSTVTPAVGTDAPGDLAAGEQESYTFVVPASGRYLLEVTLSTLADAVLSLFPPGSGTPIQTDDDGGIGRGSRILRDLTPGTWTARVSGDTASDAGTFTLTVRGRPATTPPVPRSKSALRILRNDAQLGRFVDLTATAVPALPEGDDFRGGALRIEDVDGDGLKDVLVATTDALTGTGGQAISSLRVLKAGPGPIFTSATALAPPPSVDSGQAEDIALVPPTFGAAQASLLLVSRVRPATSQDGRYTRLFDWNR